MLKVRAEGMKPVSFTSNNGLNTFSESGNVE